LLAALTAAGSAGPARVGERMSDCVTGWPSFAPFSSPIESRELLTLRRKHTSGVNASLVFQSNNEQRVRLRNARRALGMKAFLNSKRKYLLLACGLITIVRGDRTLDEVRCASLAPVEAGDCGGAPSERSGEAGVFGLSPAGVNCLEASIKKLDGCQEVGLRKRPHKQGSVKSESPTRGRKGMKDLLAGEVGHDHGGDDRRKRVCSPRRRGVDGARVQLGCVLSSDLQGGRQMPG
jgi:hypothetical protein